MRTAGLELASTGVDKILGKIVDKAYLVGMAKRVPPEDDFGEVGEYGFQGEDVVLRQFMDSFANPGENAARAVLLPLSLSRLGQGKIELLADAQDIVRRRAQLLGTLADVVAHCRAAGIPWTAIGWSTGLTAQGAQQRWGIPREGRS